MRWLSDLAVKKLIVGAGTGFLRAFYHVCGILPHHPNKIVCLSRQSNEEPVDFKLVRVHLEGNSPFYRVVVLAKTLDNPLGYCFHILRQVYHLATSKAVLLDSYCIPVSLLGATVKAPVIQMWHAMGNMKRFGYTSMGEGEGRSEETARLLHMHEGYDSILISSMSFADDFAAGFGVSTALMYEAPLPKADLFLDHMVRDHQRQLFAEAFPQAHGKKNIVYCPTFRREAAPNEREAMQTLLDAIDFDRYNLIYKKHPVSTQSFDDERVISKFPDGFEPLYVADYVISDYSTVIYEAGLLEVPVYLYAYDWDSYTQKRGLNIDIEHDVPTLFTDDISKIMAAIEADEFDHEAYAAFIARNIALPKNQTCTERVVDHVLDMIEKNR